MSGAGFCSMAGIVDAVACDAIANEERERENVGNTAGLQRVGRSLALTVFRCCFFLSAASCKRQERVPTKLGRAESLSLWLHTHHDKKTSLRGRPPRRGKLAVPPMRFAARAIAAMHSHPRDAAHARLGSAGQFHDPPRPTTAPAYRGQRQAAAARVGLWRDEQRQKQNAEKKLLAPPWWKAREATATKERLRMWADEALEKATPSRSLKASASSPAIVGTATKCEWQLQQKLREHAQLVARLQRFALLNEETFVGEGATGVKTTVMREVAGLDESRSLLADLLCSYRVATTAVVEAVRACNEDQSDEQHVTLNLPAVKAAFNPKGAAPLKRRASFDKNLPGSDQGFAAYSQRRHAAILCQLTTQVGAFMPVPLAHDPLLLKWFDDHSELWQVCDCRFRCTRTHACTQPHCAHTPAQPHCAHMPAQPHLITTPIVPLASRRRRQRRCRQ